MLEWDLSATRFPVGRLTAYPAESGTLIGGSSWRLTASLTFRFAAQSRYGVRIKIASIETARVAEQSIPPSRMPREANSRVAVTSAGDRRPRIESELI
jgi:hypothetical protein